MLTSVEKLNFVLIFSTLFPEIDLINKKIDNKKMNPDKAYGNADGGTPNPSPGGQATGMTQKMLNPDMRHKTAEETKSFLCMHLSPI
jgi:hypothetical protein